MIFDLLHSPYQQGYGEALLPLALCKTHLRVDGDEDDDLIEALRDASIEFVERYCSIRLVETPGQIWRSDSFPNGDRYPIMLGMGPIKVITAIKWLDSAGADVNGDPALVRLAGTGDLLPAVGARWPVRIGGGVEITFTAGFPAGQAPATLLTAARMFLGHLYKNREAVTDRGTEAEVPFGVQQLCASHRRVMI